MKEITSKEVGGGGVKPPSPFVVYDHEGRKLGTAETFDTAKIMHVRALAKDNCKVLFQAYYGVCVNSEFYGHPVFNLSEVA